MSKKQTQKTARRFPPTFAAVSTQLGIALADTLEHPECPEYIRQYICDYHGGLMTEFNCDVADDIRLRFALGAQKAAEGHRPA